MISFSTERLNALNIGMEQKDETRCMESIVRRFKCKILFQLNYEIISSIPKNVVVLFTVNSIYMFNHRHMDDNFCVVTFRTEHGKSENEKSLDFSIFTVNINCTLSANVLSAKRK